MRRYVIAAMALAIATPAVGQAVVQFDFGPPPPHGSFWEGAPPDLRERIHIVDVRMNRLHQDGRLSDAEWTSDREEFNRIRILYEELTKFENGSISQREHTWLWNRLSYLSDKLHWQSGYGY